MGKIVQPSSVASIGFEVREALLAARDIEALARGRFLKARVEVRHGSLLTPQLERHDVVRLRALHDALGVELTIRRVEIGHHLGLRARCLCGLLILWRGRASLQEHRAHRREASRVEKSS